MSTSGSEPADMFPGELVMELLSWLPGKELVRCKSVCKLWRSIIGSAHFKDIYGSRRRGLICYRVEPHKNHPECVEADVLGYWWYLNFYYYPIRGLKNPEEEGFSCLYKLKINRDNFRMTQVVNGLLCVDRGWPGVTISASLTIYNVFTGETMRIPDFLHCKDKHPTFHLGYDPESRTYKLLRLTSQLPPVAHIMTLRPSSTPSTWRELNRDAAGIPEDDIAWSREMRISPSDGFLCWLWSVDRSPKGLVLFDINKEKFQKIWLPGELASDWDSFVVVCGRAQVMEHKRLAVSLWFITYTSAARDVHPEGLCFVMDDDEGERWSKQVAEFPVRNANGNVCDVALMKDLANGFYHCDRRDHCKFQFGKLHDGDINAWRDRRHYWSCCLERLIGIPSRIVDGNNLYLPLHDIFSG